MLNEVIDVANNALNVLENFHFDPNAPWDYYAKAGLADSLFTSMESALNRARENFKAIRNVKRWRTKIYVICNDYGIIQDAVGGGKLRYLAASNTFEEFEGDKANTLGSCSSPVNEGSHIYGYGFTPEIDKSIDDHQYIVFCRNESLSQASQGSLNPDSLVLYEIAQWNNHFNFCFGYAETPTALWQNLRATEEGMATINTWRLTDPNPQAQGQAGQAGA
ncbi:hypothetical protein K449DRAFT_438945 [Hypoxylon sp. EC38]|nr:hypothetical protein K449DRAFT_438945 [Hypoxylon sp. EC38]